MVNTVESIRDQFVEKLQSNEWVQDKTGAPMLEIIGATFVADEDHIFGHPSQQYIHRELEWYKSGSLYVDDIPDGTPKIWEQVSSKHGRINSNYGWCIWSPQNGNQYNEVLNTLSRDPTSRRAVMIYQRPSMHIDYNADGMSDFICTNAVQYMIRDGQLHAVVQMRSNDAWAGYRNDYAWQIYVLRILAIDLQVKPGNIYWNAGSLHIYPNQLHLVNHYAETGESHISKSEYMEIYGATESA